MDTFRTFSRRRILVFLGANEAGGTALLYRILQATKHPLLIYYQSRYAGDGQTACEFLTKDPIIRKELNRTNSLMKTYTATLGFRDLTNTRNGITNHFLKHFKSTYGERPISYFIVNGHPNFGYEINPRESKVQRQQRLTKYWSPTTGALERTVLADPNNQFEYQNRFIVTQNYVRVITTMLFCLLPLIRNDGEGTVVLRTPCAGHLDQIKSKDLRLKLANPTSYSFQTSVTELVEISQQMANKRMPIASPWPVKEFYTELGDIYARSAIALYRSFTPFDNIIFNRCAYDPEDFDGPVRMLLADDRASLQSEPFTEEDIKVASADQKGDVEYRLGGSSLTRRVSKIQLSSQLTNSNLYASKPKAFNVEQFQKMYPKPMDAATPLIRPTYIRPRGMDPLAWSTVITDLKPKDTLGDKTPRWFRRG
ncbi:hypothetical protein H072_4138 [Dactylellina haptotyla CBS 200.50]|uniref:Uncharacterized protein n=1 Tax=Dactylellina haptotyla (strain CBS 200.50) TaxID=1284197 RepID=S8BR39_DACHA|nr:hypothetical protein H072_4138 [Dactylellina haptotyla CBS 200.50]